MPLYTTNAFRGAVLLPRSKNYRSNLFAVSRRFILNSHCPRLFSLLLTGYNGGFRSTGCILLRCCVRNSCVAQYCQLKYKTEETISRTDLENSLDELESMCFALLLVDMGGWEKGGAYRGKFVFLGNRMLSYHDQDTVNPEAACTLIRQCGKVLGDEETGEQKKELMHRIFEIVENKLGSVDVSLYNCAMKTMLEDNIEFSPRSYMEVMAADRIQIDQETYELFLAQYAELGDLPAMQEVIKIMVHMQFSIGTVRVRQAILYVIKKLRNLDARFLRDDLLPLISINSFLDKLSAVIEYGGGEINNNAAVDDFFGAIEQLINGDDEMTNAFVDEADRLIHEKASYASALQQSITSSSQSAETFSFEDGSKTLPPEKARPLTISEQLLAETRASEESLTSTEALANTVSSGQQSLTKVKLPGKSAVDESLILRQLEAMERLELWRSMNQRRRQPVANQKTPAIKPTVVVDLHRNNQCPGPAGGLAWVEPPRVPMSEHERALGAALDAYRRGGDLEAFGARLRGINQLTNPMSALRQVADTLIEAIEKELEPKRMDDSSKFKMRVIDSLLNQTKSIPAWLSAQMNRYKTMLDSQCLVSLLHLYSYLRQEHNRSPEQFVRQSDNNDFLERWTEILVRRLGRVNNDEFSAVAQIIWRSHQRMRSPPRRELLNEMMYRSERALPTLSVQDLHELFVTVTGLCTEVKKELMERFFVAIRQKQAEFSEDAIVDVFSSLVELKASGDRFDAALCDELVTEIYQRRNLLTSAQLQRCFLLLKFLKRYLDLERFRAEFNKMKAEAQAVPAPTSLLGYALLSSASPCTGSAPVVQDDRLIASLKRLSAAQYKLDAVKQWVWCDHSASHLDILLVKHGKMVALFRDGPDRFRVCPDGSLQLRTLYNIEKTVLEQAWFIVKRVRFDSELMLRNSSDAQYDSFVVDLLKDTGLVGTVGNNKKK